MITKQHIKAFVVLITGLALCHSAVIHWARFSIPHWRKSSLAYWTKFSFEEVCARSKGPIVDEIGDIPSVTACSYRCSTKDHCKSLYYYESTNICQISNQATVFSKNESCATEYKVLYGKVFQAGVDLSDWIGYPCLSDADCTRINSTCIKSTCTCKNGYSYRSSDDSCVDFCEEYGSTFKEEDYYIAGYMSGWTDISLDDCFQNCIDSGVQCRFVSFYVRHNVFGSCLMTNEPGLTKPDKYIKHTRSKIKYQHYLRNCA